MNQSDALILKYFPDPNNTTISGVPVTNPSSTQSASINSDLYVRSEYAPAYGIEIEKKYKNITSSTLHGGDRIQVEITLKNTTASTMKNIEYLDTLPKIFTLPNEAKYQVIL